MPKLLPGYRDEVKEKILEVAWQVLLEKGVQESTIDDFAKALNCSKGAIYNYFKNKEELLEEAIASGPLRFRDELFPRFSEGDFFGNAEKYFDIEMTRSVSHMQTTFGLMLEGTRNERIKKALKIKFDGAIDAIIELLEEMVSSGKISISEDLATAARSFYTLRFGVLMSLTSGIAKGEAKKIWMDGIRSIIK